jgi:hypothetical protein
MVRNWPVASQQDRDRCRQCALLPAGRGTVTIAAARLLRCRRAREQYPCVTTGSAAEGAGDAPLASPGARWTWEEDEELVAAVRAGADLTLIAEQRGRTRGAIVSRLLRMIPRRISPKRSSSAGSWRGWLIPASTGARRLPILGPADEAPAHCLLPRHLTSARYSTSGSGLTTAASGGPGSSPVRRSATWWSSRRRSLGTRAPSVPGAWPSAAQ